VPREEAEVAQARLLDLVPAGHELADHATGVELAVYVDESELERVQEAFPAARAAPVGGDWEHAWKRYHRGSVVGSLWVGPPWERPPHGLTPVVLDPGRAFGTGNHATTRLCLELLSRLPRSSVADLGCGSGVLAIAAAKLGHAPVWALDVDPAAVEAAAQNAGANGVRLEVRLADVTVDPLPPSEIVLANLALEPLRAIARRVASRFIVASGYLDSESPAPERFVLVERLEADGWAAELYARE
jgi:ribosomal protein L11 methyltransferase